MDQSQSFFVITYKWFFLIILKRFWGWFPLPVTRTNIIGYTAKRLNVFCLKDSFWLNSAICNKVIRCICANHWLQNFTNSCLWCSLSRFRHVVDICDSYWCPFRRWFTLLSRISLINWMLQYQSESFRQLTRPLTRSLKWIRFGTCRDSLSASRKQDKKCSFTGTNLKKNPRSARVMFL